MRSCLRPGLLFLVMGIAAAGCYEATDTATKKVAVKSTAAEKKSTEAAKSAEGAAPAKSDTAGKAVAGEYALTVEGMT